MLEKWANLASRMGLGFIETLWRPENREAAILLGGMGAAVTLGVSAAIGAAMANGRRKRQARATGVQAVTGFGPAQDATSQPPPAVTIKPAIEARSAAAAYEDILWLTPNDARAAEGLRALGAAADDAWGRLAARLRR